MPPCAQPDGRNGDSSNDRSASVDGRDAIGDLFHGGRALDEKELDSTLQLLVERAQYITGSTGAALALPQDGGMVCRASAGSSAPGVGARLQVGSGLTFESIARRQLLRCDNAESDPRVNLEACRALGIASIVVLPLLRRNGEVRGLFELFSDHPYAFEERDLIALERMADLTLTALDLADQAPRPLPAVERERDTAGELPLENASGVLAENVVEAGPASLSESKSKSDFLPEVALETPAESLPESLLESLRKLSEASGALSPQPDTESTTEGKVPAALDQGKSSDGGPAGSSEVLSSEVLSSVSSPAGVPPAGDIVPEAQLRVEKCDACGFPVSEGRSLCLDCEKKDAGNKSNEAGTPEQSAATDAGSSLPELSPELLPGSASSSSLSLSSSLSPPLPAPDEFVPAFLANSQKVSWLSDHTNLLAIIVLILGILVAVVVFR